MQLDDWVLCRIYNKKGSIEKQNNAAAAAVVGQCLAAGSPEAFEQKPVIQPHGSSALPPVPPSAAVGMFNELAYLDTSDSVPRLHTDSSCSEHVLSPEFACEREVQSEPTKMIEWEQADLDFPFNYVDATMDTTYTSPLQDMFMFLQKPY